MSNLLLPQALRTDEAAEQIDQERNYYVVQRNELIRNARFTIKRESEKSPQEPTATERKFILYLISKLTPEMRRFDEVIIDIRKFYEIIGADADNGNQYKKLRKTVKEMYDMTITVYDERSVNGRDLHFLSWKEENYARGKVMLKLNDDLIPYLLSLTANYTQYSFHNVLCMHSKHAILLYQILKSYSYNRPGIIFSVDDLKSNLEADSYKQFSDFKKRVITPAIRDINKYSDLVVDADYIKTGKAVSHIRFTFKSIERPKTNEELEEADKRFRAVEKEVNPNQLFMDGFLGGSF